ncbi:hypothetical protein [uncultured Paraglaciecola sp.]|uniref:hypothetical protein n=1 Tax=uncultured Paraglaciecola sp. TaxID=1765024 RepID=UPI0030DC58C2|tara:strand:- start:94023 stop:96608 length:2586 start_codon:yes stop_codon:yes gene_type:complete
MIDSPTIKLLVEHEPNLHNDQKKCCEVSVPLPKSKVFALEQLSITSATDNQSDKPREIDALCQVVAYWPDHSFKWVKLIYQYISQTQLYLNIGTSNAATTSTLPNKLIEKAEVIDNYSLKGGSEALTLSLENNQLTMLDDKGDAILSLNADDLKLTDSQGQRVKTDFKHASVVQHSNLKNNASSAVTLKIDGHFSDTLVYFQLMVEWLIPFELMKFTLQIHNTNRAIHQGGKWDLGDAGSFNFKSLDIELNTVKKTVTEHNILTDVQNNQTYNADNIACEQFSSGGVNWQSPVHVNHNNQVEINKNGFVLNDGQSGLRCQPVVTLKNNLTITLDQFWQNFPKSLTVKDNIVSLGLFPETHYLHELQGGEKKSHTFWISLNSANNDLTTRHQTIRGNIDWEWISQCDLYPFIEKETVTANSLQSIIDLGINSTASFIEKRENLDEYGWRHFGELYADHETADYQGEDIFVSHYNNQYDPIYGFLRQYLTTGNTKWFELADDLATHVKDIDIYHTKLDKNEYNGGLFWHTDHYLQAFTSSHRSYSKHQASDVYQDHAGGGGPGGQHCYTTGLYLHYCMTGQQSSKDAVLTLANWITHVYEGSGTCLELLLAFKNRHVAGYKNHFTGQYPLDRGIANYVNALLDSFELTQNDNYLTKVQNIFANAMHPDEDLADRDLQNVEITWFYTVLLQALCRYLQVKQSRKEFDKHFYYCRDCLLNFADWMLIHEYPYLQKPDILEYPNDTWTAQDLRKAHVLAGAYYFSPDKKIEYLNKAQFFQQYVTDKLTKADTKTYTRILVLLMQNQGAMECFQKRPSPIAFAPRKNWPAAKYQQTSLFGGLLKVFTKRLIKLSPRAEFDWLKKRLA